VLKAAPGLPFSFSRHNRLVSDADFQSVFRQSKKVTRSSLLVLFKPNQLPQARLGMVVPKRYVKHAVHRNAWRRVVRESFRHHQAKLQGFDLIVMAKSARGVQDKQALRAELDGVWQHLK
jgi:ribonuclease P protein component